MKDSRFKVYSDVDVDAWRHAVHAERERRKPKLKPRLKLKTDGDLLQRTLGDLGYAARYVGRIRDGVVLDCLGKPWRRA